MQHYKTSSLPIATLHVVADPLGSPLLITGIEASTFYNLTAEQRHDMEYIKFFFTESQD